MTEFILDRRTITERVLSEIDPYYTESETQRALNTWWKNIRDSGGLGLTDLGLQAFQNAELESWAFTLTVNDLKNSLGSWAFNLGLDRKMPCPYYVKFNSRSLEKTVIVFDSRVASMITLYGNLKDYMLTLPVRPNAADLTDVYKPKE